MYCEANAANKQKLKTSCEKVSCTKHQSNQHNDSWNEMQFCKSNTADRIPSTNNFAVAKLIEFSTKLIRVNEAHHSGLVPERITKRKKNYLALKLGTEMIPQSTEDNQQGSFT